MKHLFKKSTAMLLAVLLVMSCLSGIASAVYAIADATVELIGVPEGKISGRYGDELADAYQLRVELIADTFTDVSEGEDVSLWLGDIGYDSAAIANEIARYGEAISCGLKAKVLTVESDQSIVIEVSGAPSKATDGFIRVTIPADKLTLATPIITAENANAMYDIAKRSLEFVSGSAEKVYDGQPLTNTDFTKIGELAIGDGLNIQMEGTITNAGTTGNTITSYMVAHKWVDVANVVHVSDVTAYYDVTASEGELKVTPAPVEAIANDVSVTYGDAIPTYTIGEYTGFVNEETAADLAGVLSFACDYDPANAVNKNVGEYTIIPSLIGSNPNYEVTFTNGKLTVGKKDLTIAADPVSIDYGADIPAYTSTITGLVAGDTVADITGIEYDCEYVKGSAKGSYVITPKNAVNDNYEITYVPANLSVGQKTVTVTIVADDKVYDGTNTAQGTYTIVGLEEGDEVTLEGGTWTFSDADAGEGKTVTFAGYTISNDNYVLGNTTAVCAATISQKELTVAITADGKVYDGTTAAVGEYTIDGKLEADTVELIGGTYSFEDKNVGTEKTVTYQGYTVSNANYKLATGADSAVATADITKAPLTIKADSFSLIYGDAVPTYTYQITGFVNSETEAVLEGTITLTCDYTSTSKVDEYTINISGYTSENYEISYVAGRVTVVTKELTISFTVNNKTYDGTADAERNEIVYTGLETGDDVVFDDSAITYAFDDENIGIGKTVTATGYTLDLVSGEDKANYVITFIQTATADITAKELTITVDNDEITYGDVAPAYTYRVEGFIEGESEELITGTANYTCSYAQGSDAGDYTISLDGLTAENYAITYVDGTLTVGKLAIEITTGDKEVEYDGTTLTYDYWQSTGNEVYALDTLAVTVTGEATVYTEEGTNNTATVVIKRGLVDITDTNYEVTVIEGKLKIKPRTITITSKDAVKVYDGTALTIDGYKLTGLLAPTDTIEVKVTGSIEVPGEVNNTINEIKLNRIGTGEDVSANYIIVRVEGKLKVTTGEYDVTIKSDDAAKVYDNTALTCDTFAVTVGALKPGDTARVTITGTVTDVSTTANTITGIVIIHTDADGNETDVTECYNITPVEGTLEITKRDMTITFNDASFIYDGEEHGDEDPTVTTDFAGEYTVECSDWTKITNVGSTTKNCTIEVMIGEDDVTANFNIITSFGTITVTQRNVIITATTSTGAYNGEIYKDETYSITGDGFVEGEGLETVVFGDSTILFAGETQVNTIVSYTLNAETDAGNYSITTVDGNIDVTVASIEITVTADTVTVTYDGNKHTGGYEIVGDKIGYGDKVVVAIEGHLVDVGTVDHVVEYVTVLHGAIDVTSNYVITKVNGTITVEPKEIAVMPTADQFKRIGEADPAEFTYTNTALVGTDAITGTLARVAGETVGEYEYDVSGLTAGANYTIVLAEGAAKFRIKGAEFEVKAESTVVISEEGKLSGIETGTSAQDVLANFDNSASDIIIKDKDGNVVTDTDAILGTGTTLTLDIGAGEPKVLTIVVIADTDGDGIISAIDYARVKRQVIGLMALDGAYAEAADVNKDGVVDAIDYALIQSVVIG